MATLATERNAVARRLGDAGTALWSYDEIEDALIRGYRALTQAVRVFADWLYAENLPRGFSYTCAFEQAIVPFDFGRANYTAAFERRLFDQDRDAEGWANYTCPSEALDGRLEASGADVSIPATADLPTSVTEIERALWDGRTIEPLAPADAMRDARFQLTEGEVYAYTWRQDGIRTFRKIRVPSAQADGYEVTGAWGAVRDIGDVTDEAVTGSWGVPRRVPGEQPIGPDRFGLPRRFYQDGLNVRIEHWRHGAVVAAPADTFELPDRYTRYLRDYACARLLDQPGDGYQPQLAAHYTARWQRGIARLQRRVSALNAARQGRMGGASAGRRANGPPRPRLPWAYGQECR